MFDIGVAQTDITPPAGLPMGGYPDIQSVPGAPPGQIPSSGYYPRVGVAQGTLDPLMASVLVARDEGSSVAIVGVDLLKVSSDFAREVRHLVAEATQIAPDGVLIAASHTHSAPDLFGYWDTVQPEHYRYIASKIADAASAAVTDLRPGRVFAAEGDISHLIVNRKNPAGPIDPCMDILRIEDEVGSVRAIVIRASGHPLILPPENLLYSGDWPARMCRIIESVYPGAVTLFLNGAAGNINPVGFPLEPKVDVIGQHRKLRAAGEPTVRGEAHLDRLARLMAAEAIRAVESSSSRSADGDPASGELMCKPVRARRTRVDLPLKSPQERALFCRYIGINKSTTEMFMSLSTFATEVQVIRLGEVCILALPGEPFVEIGIALKALMPGQARWVVGYANDDARYIPTDEAFKGNVYETFGTPLTMGSEPALVRAASALLSEVS